MLLHLLISSSDHAAQGLTQSNKRHAHYSNQGGCRMYTYCSTSPWSRPKLGFATQEECRTFLQTVPAHTHEQRCHFTCNAVPSSNSWAIPDNQGALRHFLNTHGCSTVHFFARSTCARRYACVTHHSFAQTTHTHVHTQLLIHLPFLSCMQMTYLWFLRLCCHDFKHSKQ